MKKIFVVGSSNTDMVVKTPKLPTPGETVLGGQFMMNAGGKGANQAVAVARLGGSTVFVCKVGRDIFGGKAIEQFNKEGIETKFVFSDPHLPSGVALINVDSYGENCITVASGANTSLSESDIDQASVFFKNGDLLLAQLEVPIPTVIYTIKIAAQKGLKVILNPAPAASLPNEIFENLFVITPNETEAEQLTGVKIIDQQTVKKAADILLKKGVKNVIITLGAKGAYLKSNHYDDFIYTDKVEAIDTTAAGDCFNGALAVALLEDKNLKEAVYFATKAATISVTRMGAQASLPYRNELP